jgi:chitin disaccharide deacetylase
MIVCADDFGLAEDVDEAIVALARKGRLSAVSCMAGLPRLNRKHVDSLLSCSGHLDIGLHLSLTSSPPCADPQCVASLVRQKRFAEFGMMLRRSLCHRVRGSDAEAEIAAQWKRFVDLCGRPPDFIDSHLHVHQFPGIRDGLVSFVSALPAERKPYVRNSHIPLRKGLAQRVPFLKAWTISLLGRPMRLLLKRNGIATNNGFAGIYDYRLWCKYGQYLEEFLASMESSSGILMVHPGFEEPWRRAEFDALCAARFPSGVPCRFRRK